MLLPPPPSESPDRQAFTELWDHLPARAWLESVRIHFGLVQTLALGTGREDETARDILSLYVEPSASSVRLTPEQIEERQQALISKGAKPELLPTGLLSRLAGEPSQNINRAEAVRMAQRSVVLGDPGSGKSTLIAWLATCLASPYNVPLPPEFSRLIPIPIILRDLARRLPANAENISWESFIAAFLSPDTGASNDAPLPISDLTSPLRLYPHLLPQWLASGQAWIMVDGFDEVSDPVRRRAIREAIWQGMGLYPKCRWLITSRVVGYDEAELDKFKTSEYTHSLSDDDSTLTIVTRDLLTGTEDVRTLKNFVRSKQYKSNWVEGGAQFAMVTQLHYLTPFTDGQVKEFLYHWFQPRLGVAKGQETAEQLFAALSHARDTRIISRVPNVLTLIALLWRQFYELPSGRTELYSRIAEAYSRSIPRMRQLAVDYSQGEKQNWLAAIGWELQMRRVSKKQVQMLTGAEPDSDPPLDDLTLTAEELRKLLHSELTKSGDNNSNETLEAFLQFVTHTSGLVYERRPGHFGFTHLSFQEYYAAQHAHSLFQRALTNSSRPRKADAFSWTQFNESLAPLAQYSNWREVGIFLAELLSRDPSLEHPSILIEQLFPEALNPQPLSVLRAPEKELDPLPSSAAELLAFISHNEKVALSMDLRHSLWHRLWLWNFAAQGSKQMKNFDIPAALLAYSPHQNAILDVLNTTVTQLPVEQRSLHLSKCAALRSLDKLPRILDSLYLIACSGLSTVDGAPPGLNTLLFAWCNSITDLNNLPDALKALFIIHCEGVKNIDHLPTSLRYLTIFSDRNLTSINNLPDGLDDLNLSGCNGLESIDNLPSSITNLNINACHALKNVNKLPISLKSLTLRDCPGISFVDSLPESLEHLVLTDCINLSTLNHLPASLRSLELTRCNSIKKINNPPKSLKKIKIIECISLNSTAKTRLRKALPDCEIVETVE